MSIFTVRYVHSPYPHGTTVHQEPYTYSELLNSGLPNATKVLVNLDTLMNGYVQNADGGWIAIQHLSLNAPRSTTSWAPRYVKSPFPEGISSYIVPSKDSTVIEALITNGTILTIDPNSLLNGFVKTQTGSWVELAYLSTRKKR